MALTRRFFTALARDFRDAKPGTGDNSTAMAVWEHMVTITANALAVQNAMFNYARFYEACGMPAEVVAVARG
jgi:hypothetical protein